MKHEIVIPFAFDTAPIEEMLQKHGKEEAMRILREMVEKNLQSAVPRKQSYGTPTKEPDWKGLMQEYFSGWLNDHKQEIIDEAALLLAAKAGCTKKWRDILAEIKEEQDV